MYYNEYFDYNNENELDFNRICLEEIKKCQFYSNGPFFIVSLSDWIKLLKYVRIFQEPFYAK